MVLELFKERTRYRCLQELPVMVNRVPVAARSMKAAEPAGRLFSTLPAELKPLQLKLIFSQQSETAVQIAV